MKQRVLTLLLAAALLAGCIVPAAASDFAGVNYVALGDGLASGALAPEALTGAYPALLAEEWGANLTDLSQGGMDSARLLELLRSDYGWYEAIHDADVITLNVGGYDLLREVAVSLAEACGEEWSEDCTPEDLQAMIAQWACGDTGGDTWSRLKELSGVLTATRTEERLTRAVAAFEENWDSIISVLRRANSRATVLVVQAYNPLTVFDGYESSRIYLSQVGDYWVGQLNAIQERCARADQYILAQPESVSCGMAVPLDTLLSQQSPDPVQLARMLCLNPRPDQAGQQELAGCIIRKLNSLALEEARQIKLPFDDIPWWSIRYPDVQMVYSAGLMQGVSDTAFDLEGTLTRAMVVTILYRLAGSPGAVWAGVFDDVPADQWYTAAVQWAYDTGVTYGSGNGCFGPNDPVTGQQLAAFIYRYAQAEGMDMTCEEAYLQQAQVLVEFRTLDNWALDCVAWALTRNMMDLDVLRPNEPATRGDTARCLAALLEAQA